jgi:hypothetical protein
VLADDGSSLRQLTLDPHATQGLLSRRPIHRYPGLDHCPVAGA